MHKITCSNQTLEINEWFEKFDKDFEEYGGVVQYVIDNQKDIWDTGEYGVLFEIKFRHGDPIHPVFDGRYFFSSTDGKEAESLILRYFEEKGLEVSRLNGNNGMWIISPSEEQKNKYGKIHKNLLEVLDNSEQSLNSLLKTYTELLDKTPNQAAYTLVIAGLQYIKKINPGDTSAIDIFVTKAREKMRTLN